MKNVLCFGDSNTWGFIPESIQAPFPQRHSISVRWTGVLARELGANYRIIEEGQNGRTTVHDDPFVPMRNGRTILPALLESQKPVDLVVMMLGTNDLKAMFGVSPGEISMGVKLLGQMILKSEAGPDNRPPQLLLLCPPAVNLKADLPDVAVKFPNAETHSRELPRYYESVAKALDCGFLNSQELVAPGSDGIHLDATAHGRLGLAVAAAVRNILES